MFRKLVSSLPFSPALVGQLGFYARRLSREQATRRLGFIFTALAIMVQAFALMSPPDQTYAASPTNECSYNDALTKNDPRCRACPYNPTTWVGSSGCNANISLSIDASNLSKNSGSSISGSGDPGDRIQYNLHTKNTSSSSISVPIQEPVNDLLQYASVIDSGGGSFDSTAKLISWGVITIPAGQTDTRNFIIQLNSSFVATPQAVDNPQSYDCTLTNSYGNTINVPLSCPASKQIEATIKHLPETGAGANVIFSLAVIMLVAYFYFRSRMMNREMRAIRREFNVG